MTVTANRESRVIVSNVGFSNPIMLDQYVEASGHVEVYADDTLLTIGTHYTLAGLLDDDGLEVTITSTGLALDPDEWVVFHNPPVEQGSDLSLGGRFGEAFELALDAVVRRMQSFEDRVNRGLRLPINTPLAVEGGEFPVASADALIGWNAAADALENKGTLPQIVTIASITAEIVAVSAKLAEITAVAGNETNIDTVAGLSTEVATLAALSAQLTTLAALDTEIATLAGLDTELAAIYAALADITAAAADLPSLAAKANKDGSNLLAADVSAMRTALGLILNGQCRLDYNSGDLKLSRQNGQFLWVNGKLCTIPSAGVTLSASGLTPNTTYNIYAEATDGVITSLVPSLTARATHTDGTQIRSGDATRAYVGKARCVTGPAWNADLVISWFNQVPKTKRVVASGGVISVGTNVLVGSGEFGVLSHGDRAIRNAYNGFLYTNAANYQGTLIVAIDGSAASYGVAATTNGAGSSWLTPIAHDYTSIPSEGYHTHGAYAQTNGDTSVFTGYFSVDYWG